MKKNNFSSNVFLIYALFALHHAWFWVPIWVLYYLRFTDYAGIGLLETIMISVTIFGEIPTGAIADLLGKKKTLFLAFVLATIGNIIMGLALSFSILALSIVILSIGGVLLSGTIEAMLYDSLLSDKNESFFEKALANSASSKMISLALSGLAGGFLYKISPNLPFLLTAFFSGIGIIVTLFLKEPPIDSEIFSWNNYLKQTKAGFNELLSKSTTRRKHIFIILLTMIIVINGHVLIDAQLVELGWNEIQLGFISTTMFLLSAAMGQLAPALSKRFGSWMSTIFSAVMIALTMIFIPFVGLLIGTTAILLRNGLIEIFGNSVSTQINKAVASKNRATALSTYSMIANIPYLFGAVILGALMDIYSAHVVTAVFGGGLMVVVLFSRRVKRFT